MKFVLKNEWTAMALSTFNPKPWIVSSFFFHDRGTREQKSLDGFLRTFIHDILSHRMELFPYLEPILSDAIAAKGPKIEGSLLNAPVAQTVWDWQRLFGAITTLERTVNTDLNLCLFVDALDEHDGPHKDLLKAFEVLESLSNNKLIRLRICAASRPENLFRTQFAAYPNLAIQDYTIQDIRAFTQGRLMGATRHILSPESKKELDNLSNEIIARANGVFLWVSLVVKELSEDIEDGYTVSEMAEVLADIPDDLRDLYSRALRRTKRVPRSQFRSKTRKSIVDMESYIMFQLVLRAEPPMSLSTLLSAAKSLVSGEVTFEIDSLSRTQQEYRLNNFSCGLLESKNDVVQFIHQTTKVFMQDDGHMVIQDKVDSSKLENGDCLILGLAIQHLGGFSDDPECMGDELIPLTYLVRYAQAINGSPENVSRKYGNLLESQLMGMSSACRTEALSRISSRYLTQAEVVFRQDQNSYFQLLSLLSLLGCHGILQQYLSGSLYRLPEVDAIAGISLLDTAFLATTETDAEEVVTAALLVSHVIFRCCFGDGGSRIGDQGISAKQAPHFFHFIHRSSVPSTWSSSCITMFRKTLHLSSQVG
jgi:hypothetical protein